MATEVLLPQYGMSMHEATIAVWLKNVGDPVTAGEAIAEVETDKITAVVEAPVTGVLARIEAEPGTTVAVFKRIAVIE
jgi:pyruvate/2-oxoglutarate dehydrogenase complex dihydrolipoamide acyltransferase (E2) component